MIKRLRKPIKMRLLVKMLMACLVVIAAFGLFWGYYALPRFQADKMLDEETKSKQEVELAVGCGQLLVQPRSLRADNHG